MANLRRALHMAKAALRANFLPGLLLQSLMLVFLLAYASHEGTRMLMEQIADRKEEAGYLFSFASYVIAAALLPEILIIGFSQGGRPKWRNLLHFLTAAPAWGSMGVLTDFFYRCQAAWFGTGNDLPTLVLKILVDQFIYSPFVSNPFTIAWFIWRDRRFRMSAGREIFRAGFFMDRVFPVQVSGWLIWIPAVALIYSMPPALQIPVAALITAFWVLIFTTLGEARSGKPERAHQPS